MRNSPHSGKDFAPEHKGAGIASFHDCPGNDPGTGAQSRNTIEIDIVQHARAIQ